MVRCGGGDEVMFDAGPGGSAKLAMRKSGMRRQSRDVNAGQVSQEPALLMDVVAQPANIE